MSSRLHDASTSLVKGKQAKINQPEGGDDLVESLRECLDVYERIADRKYSECQLAYGGRVWIMLSDITTATAILALTNDCAAAG
jgi:hypothetical protein